MRQAAHKVYKTVLLRKVRTCMEPEDGHVAKRLPVTHSSQANHPLVGAPRRWRDKHVAVGGQSLAAFEQIRVYE